MTDSGQTLLEKLEGHIAVNLHNEQFGVEQLAEMMGMSRSHLHRKLHKVKGKSISRFIREFRLEKARQMLIVKEMTASEVSHAVGFGSPSYFNKCFTEYFGYSPGKARLKVGQEITGYAGSSKSKSWLWIGGLAATVLLGFLIFSQNKKEVVVAETPPKEKSIIVLPFKNLSSDEENQYLVDGMVDAISRHLSEINELKVLSPLSMIQFANEEPTLKTIGKTLNVSNILRGSLQRNGDLMRVEVSLLNISNEKQIWSQNYDRRFDDILKIQNDIARNVASAMETNLTTKEIALLEKRTSYNAEAYDNFLKGWNYLMTATPESHAKSLPFFKKALEIDSTMVFSQIGMVAYYHFAASIFAAEQQPRNALQLAEEHLLKAEKLDPDLYHVHASRGYQALVKDWDFEQSEKSYTKASYADIPLHYVILRDLYHLENRHEEAFEIAKKVNDKFYHYPISILTNSFYYFNEWDKGKSYVKEPLKLHPNSYYTVENSGFFFLNTGDHQNAIKLLQGILDTAPYRIPRTMGLLGAAFAKHGKTEKARELLTELEVLKKKTNAGSPAFFIAIIHSAFGEEQEALKWLKIAIDDHEMEVPWLVAEPQLYPLHGMPEFDALVKQVGFRDHAYPVELPEKLY